MKHAGTEGLRRLRWRCRRGLLELDILLARFLDERYATLSAAQQASFHCLLEQADPALLAWFQGRQEPPSDLKKIIEIVVQ